MREIQQVTKAASKLLTKKIETKLLAVCEITGIAITIEAPAIGYALEYRNPLALPKNFLQLAELPFSTLSQFEPSILAGITLAILKNWEMIEGSPATLSAAEQNILLQTAPPFVLIKYLKFFARNLSVHKNAYSYLPKVSIHGRLAGEPHTVNITSTLEGHLEECRNILFPQRDERELKEIYDEVEAIYQSKNGTTNRKIAEAILRARKTREAQQRSLLREGRKILKELKASSILSEKFLNFLSILLSGEYLATAEETTKERAVRILEKHQLPACIQLVKIIKDRAFTSKIDSLFVHEKDVEVEEELEAVEREEETSKNSLVQLLKAKLAANLTKKNISSVSLKESQEEKEEEEIEIEGEAEIEEMENEDEQF